MICDPKCGFILKNVSCALEKKVYSAFGWDVLRISVRSISSNVAFMTCVSLFIFCFDHLSIGVSIKVSYYYCVTVNFSFYVCSVQFSRSVVSNSLRPHELQHARPLSVYLMCWGTPKLHRYLQLLCLPPGLILWSM